MPEGGALCRALDPPTTGRPGDGAGNDIGVTAWDLRPVPSQLRDFGHAAIGGGRRRSTAQARTPVPMTRGSPGDPASYTRSMARERLGILGGTFDPPHIGHLAAAVEVRDAFALDRVLLMVANEPWQKTGGRVLSSASDRLDLVRAAVIGIDGIEASAVEIERGGPTYTIDTLEHLRALDPEVELFVVLGADAADGLHTWHRHEELPALATLVVVDRAGEAEPTIPAGWTVEHLGIPRIDVSSTGLRARAAAGRPLRPYVPGPVVDLLLERSMYGSRRP